MKYIDFDGYVIQEDNGQDRFLKKLYSTSMGRVALKVLIQPWISKVGGAFLSSPFSKCFIKPFIEANKIDMDEYVEKRYKSYNDFFAREIEPAARPIPEDPKVLISPCDSRVTAYEITEDCTLSIKGTNYTVESLLKSKKLAKHFKGGYAVVLRLSVDDYHRYSYIDDGLKSENYYIPGVFHTVNPVAAETYPIYKENAREFTMMKTKNFGHVIQMEVGALMVGKILNHHGYGTMKRGEEKGYFEFGGSTIVLLLQKDAVSIDEAFLERTKDDCETRIRQGERLGVSKL